MKQFNRFSLWIFTLSIIASCSQSDFAGSNAQPSKKKTPTENQVVSPPVQVDPGTQVDPNGMVIDNNGDFKLDYSLCTALPTGGYAGSGVCAVNEIMVIINDGKAGGRTCCPIGNGILSQVPAEMNQAKPGLCGPDEVATGIQAMTVPFCTKINTQLFSLEPAGVSVRGLKASSGLLGQLAAKYNKGDCCACPEGTVMIGGHTTADNKCTDQCVKIVPKAK